LYIYLFILIIYTNSYFIGIVLSGDERIPNSSSSSSEDDVSANNNQPRNLNQALNQVPNKLLQRHEASVQQQVKQNNQIISELIGKAIKPSVINKDLNKDIKEVNNANRDKEFKEHQVIKDKQQQANTVKDVIKDAKQVIKSRVPGPVIKKHGGDWFNNLANQMGELKGQIQDLKIKSPLISNNNNDNQSKESFDIDIVSKISPYEQREMNNITNDSSIPVSPSLHKSPSAQVLKPPLVPKSSGNSKPVVSRQSPVPFTSQSSSPLLKKKSRKSVGEKTKRNISPTPSNNLPNSREQLQQRREIRIQKSEELKEFIKLQREEIKKSPSVVITSPDFVDVDINSIIDEDKLLENFNFIPVVNDIIPTLKTNSKVITPSGRSRTSSNSSIGKPLSSSKSPKNYNNNNSKKKILKSVAELKAIHDAERIEMKLQMKLLKIKNENVSNGDDVSIDNLTTSNRVNIDLMNDMNAEEESCIDISTTESSLIDEIPVIPLSKSDYSNINIENKNSDNLLDIEIEKLDRHGCHILHNVNNEDEELEEVQLNENDYVQVDYNNNGDDINNVIDSNKESFETEITCKSLAATITSTDVDSSNKMPQSVIVDMMVRSIIYVFIYSY
jgi:hypothetical protein